MVLLHTLNPHKPTYYSGSHMGHESNIDFVAIPMSVFITHLIGSHLWLLTGRKLQLIKRALLVDHVPVCLEIATNTYWSNLGSPPKLDRDARMRSVTNGFRRKQFIETIEQKIAKYSSTEEDKNAMASNSSTFYYSLQSADPSASWGKHKHIYARWHPKGSWTSRTCRRQEEDMKRKVLDRV